MSSEAQERQSSTESDSPPQSPTLKKSQLTGPCLTTQVHGYICPHVTASSSEGHNYYITFHRIKKPDIKVVRDQQGGPLAAVAYIHSWSRIYHIGVGHDDTSMQWVDSKTKVYPKRPTFEWKGETYILARVSKDENGEKLKKAKWWWYFGVRDGAGGWVALCSPGDAKGKSILKLAEGVTEELGLVILLAISSWKEEMKRAG